MGANWGLVSVAAPYLIPPLIGQANNGLDRHLSPLFILWFSPALLAITIGDYSRLGHMLDA